MATKSIISEIDAEIARLEQVKALLANGDKPTARKAAKKANGKQTKKRKMSPEGRKRIATAQRKRWAQTRKLAEMSAVSKKPKRAAKKRAKKVTAKAEGSSAVPF
jgi:hypothetical protein